jgi:hypothetical protein
MFTNLTVLAHLKTPASKQKTYQNTRSWRRSAFPSPHFLKLHKTPADGSSDQNATCKAMRKCIIK